MESGFGRDMCVAETPLSLQVWDLPAFGGQILRAAG